MNILVLCTGNSARSILLESLLNRHGAARVTAFSAGSRPAGQVHPGALKLLQQKGFATASLRSKRWDEFAGPQAVQMDLVITVCGNAAAETCPIWPGAPLRAHWGVDDPAAASPDTQDAAFDTAYRRLSVPALAFLDAPVETMDNTALKALLDRIGSDI